MENIIQTYARHPERPISGEEASTLLDKYSYFTLPALLSLKHDRQIDAATRRHLSQYAALTAGSAQRLSQLLGDDAAVFENFYPEKATVTPSTDDTLNKFLEKYGSGNDRETDILTEMIFNPTPSYEAVLASEAAGMEREEKSASVSTATTEESAYSELSKKNKPRSAESLALTESLARVMIKNRNYSKALEIISELHLNNPEKSIYFADQIRFLRKLIINAKQK